MIEKARIIKERVEGMLNLDLSSKSSIEHFSEIVLKEISNIDVLYNNAGLIYNPYQLTEEGYESMIAVNVYGSFRLSLLLLENIERAKGNIQRGNGCPCRRA